ncbi:hypothetical protein FB45DRAFT_29434 [Roridomyces roridus]|uniref:Uncharacterized protein n=1 Tax=Roridomyces roridus TaxID=1738132 RepID=A0AAD7FZD1_9AGAR|nr:hypothetical protein FB45DRAFT_29434 [Roridomyces roridus]
MNPQPPIPTSVLDSFRKATTANAGPVAGPSQRPPQQGTAYPAFTADGRYATLPGSAAQPRPVPQNSMPNTTFVPIASFNRPSTLPLRPQYIPPPSAPMTPHPPAPNFTMQRPQTAPQPISSVPGSSHIPITPRPPIQSTPFTLPPSAPPPMPPVPAAEVDRHMHTKYLEGRSEWLANALNDTEKARKQLQQDRDMALDVGRRLNTDLRAAREAEARLRQERDDARAQLRQQQDALAREARLIQERDAARAQLKPQQEALAAAAATEQRLRKERDDARVQVSEYAVMHEEAQLFIQSIQHQKELLEQAVHALRTDNDQLKLTMRRFGQSAKAHFYRMQAQLDEAKAASQAKPAEPSIKSEPDMDVPELEDLDLQYPPEPSPPPLPAIASMSVGGGSVFSMDNLTPGSTFYTWDPPPDRKRGRPDCKEEEDDDDVDVKRPRRDSSSSDLEISMGPAFPIPRELNFDVKTLSSPVHYFMEIRRKAG